MFTALNKYGHMIGPAHPQGQYALWSGINCKSLISIQCSLFWFSRKLMLTSISINVINCTQDLDQGPLVNLVIVISNWIPVHWVDWHCFHSCKCYGFAVVSTQYVVRIHSYFQLHLLTTGTMLFFHEEIESNWSTFQGIIHVLCFTCSCASINN